MLRTASRFYTVQLCCAEASILECASGRELTDFRILRKFSLPVEELHLWKPKYPVYVCLPSNMFFFKQVELICPSGIPYELAIGYEYDKNIPFPSHAVYWTFAILDTEEELFKPGVILGGRTEVIEKWVRKVPTPLDRTSGITPYISSLYNLTRYLDVEVNLRREDKVSLILFCDSRFTDLIIIGEKPSRDLFRTFTRAYGNVSLIWDIKETLEMYFAKFSPRVGDVPITKDIDRAYVICSGEIERQREWELVFSEQVGVKLEDFPLGTVMSTFFSDEMLSEEQMKSYCLAFGLAMMFAPERFSALKMLIPLQAELLVPSSSYANLWLQVGLVVGASVALGNFYLNTYLPSLTKDKELRTILESYSKVKKQKRQLSQRKGILEKQIAQIERVVKEQYKWQELILLLSRSMEGLDEVKIDELSGKILGEIPSQFSVSIKISAKDYDVLNEFLRRLRDSHRFEKVSPVTSRFDETKEKVEMLLILEM